MRKVAEGTPNAQVLVRAVKFSNGAQWHLSQPTPVAGCARSRTARSITARTSASRSRSVPASTSGAARSTAARTQASPCGKTGPRSSVECDVYDNRLAYLGMSEGAKLTARACHIHEGDNSGVFVHREGEAVLEGCELYGHREAEAAVTTRGGLFLNDRRVRNGYETGVLVRDGGEALLQACVVSGGWSRG